MGTRADFYVGRGKTAKWIGSIAFDGFPDGDPADAIDAKTLRQYRARVKACLVANTGNSSDPTNGDPWPWPWETSATTDFAYAFDRGKVYASYFGSDWVSSKRVMQSGEFPESKGAEFPQMEKPKHLNTSKNGIIMFSTGGLPHAN